jgi:hypothetical protein
VTRSSMRPCDSAADRTCGSGPRQSPGRNPRCGKHRRSSMPGNPRLGRDLVENLNGSKPNRHLRHKAQDARAARQSGCNEDGLNTPDKRGACILATTTIAQQAGADPHDTGERQFWTPETNAADPGFPGHPDRFPHDAMGDDGHRAGLFQQQPNGSGDARRWRCGDQTGVP